MLPIKHLMGHYAPLLESVESCSESRIELGHIAEDLNVRTVVLIAADHWQPSIRDHRQIPWIPSLWRPYSDVPFSRQVKTRSSDDSTVLESLHTELAFSYFFIFLLHCSSCSTYQYPPFVSVV